MTEGGAGWGEMEVTSNGCGVSFVFDYLFLAVLSLHCCASFSLVVASRGYALVEVCSLFIGVTSCFEARVPRCMGSVVAPCGL